MAERTKQEELQAQLKAYADGGQFYNKRAWCTDGSAQEFILEDRAKKKVTPDVGEFCLKLIQISADTEANPTEKAQRPDKKMVGLYQAFARDKGYGVIPEDVSDDFATRVLGMYNKFSARPDAYQIWVGESEIPSKPGKSWVFTPGSAFDAAFSQIVLDSAAGKPAPAPTATTPAKKAELAAVTEKCFQTAKEIKASGVTIGQCADAGKEQAAQYFEAKKAARAK